MKLYVVLLFILFNLMGCKEKPIANERSSSYSDLVNFFMDWRKFQVPNMVAGIPDYSASAMVDQHQALSLWQQKLMSFDTTGWPIKHQIDWYLVFAEMNGLDFDHRVIQPWAKDPAFYVWFYPSPSDVPEREGPNMHEAIELNTYGDSFSIDEVNMLELQLGLSEKIVDQAKINLIGNGKDLWVTGVRSIKEQSTDLEAFAKKMAHLYPSLAQAALRSKNASDRFVAWLEDQAVHKTGPSGIGKNNYDWYVKKVHLSPYTWDQEHLLLQRELARSHASLRFSEHRNRLLPKLQKAGDAISYNKLLTDGVEEFLDFFEIDSFISIKPYMKKALMDQVGPYTSQEGIRGFFDEIDYRDPMPMRAHHFHWIEKEREILEPLESPIRKVPLLYNIFDSRAEGLATALEELVMNAGLLTNRPRATELVYIMLAQRAARGLAGLYQHSLEMTLDESTQYAAKWVPWGLLPADGSTIQHEEQFYLEQPGYGSSYVIGKIDIDRLIAEYARQREGSFKLIEFMDDLCRVGIIPMSLIYWEMTGSRALLDEALR